MSVVVVPEIEVEKRPRVEIPAIEERVIEPQNQRVD